MKNIQLAVILLLLSATTASADPGQPDPAQWYQDDYGALWLDQPWNKQDKIAQYYESKISTHEASGEMTTVDFAPWLAGAIEEWRADDWLWSEVSALKVDRLNASTVTFKASWRDHYGERDDEISCGWYLADLHDGQWKFTNYATIDCAEHGF